MTERKAYSSWWCMPNVHRRWTVCRCVVRAGHVCLPLQLRELGSAARCRWRDCGAISATAGHKLGLTRGRYEMGCGRICGVLGGWGIEESGKYV